MEGGRPRDSGQSIEDAIKREHVSFSQQFTALYRQYRVPEADEAARWRDIYTRAREAFEASHGGLERSSYADNFAAGVALTSDGELHDDVWFDDLDYETAEAARLWTDLRTLHERIDTYLAGNTRDRKVSLRALFDLFVGLINAMGVEWKVYAREHQRTPSEAFHRSVEQISRQLEALEQRYLEFARTHSVHVYLRGVAWGTLLMAIVLSVSWPVLGWADTDVFPWVPVMAAGAVGAGLSVLVRNASGKLDVQVEADHWGTLIGGTSRPAVGAVSAIAIYVLVKAGLVPLDVPDDETTARFFFTGVGFLAGFSERFAPDAFGTAESAVRPRQSS